MTRTIQIAIIQFIDAVIDSFVFHSRNFKSNYSASNEKISFFFRVFFVVVLVLVVVLSSPS